MEYANIFYSTQGELVESFSPTNAIQLYPQEIELQNHLKELLPLNKTIRAHGGNHSNYFDNAFYRAEIAIDLQKYTITPYLNGNILTASAGSSLDSLRKFLKPYNLRLFGTPESKFITLGGAVLNGAHNGSAMHKTMSDYVTEMLFFDSTGAVRRTTDKSLFSNFGAIGIVFRISIQVFPATNIYWQRIMHKSIDNVSIVPATHSLVFDPYGKRVMESRIYPTNAPAKSSISYSLWNILPELLSIPYVTKIFSNVARGMFYVFPSMGLIVTEYFLLEPSVVKDKFDYFYASPQANLYTQEYAVNVDMLKNVYLEIMQLIAAYRKIGTYVSYRFWVRFVPKSDVPNTMPYNQDSAVFELTYSKDQPNAKMFAYDIDGIFRKYGGKPHTGKTLISPESLSNYDFEKFKKEIRGYDPNGIFQNEFMKKVLKN